MNEPAAGTYRLITRSDMDGLVCAVLLRELGMLGEIVFHHPKDVQDGKVAVTARDILTNLPYVPGCGMCFDHHASEALRNSGEPTPGNNLQPDAKSAARVVYDHFGGKARFPRISDEMMAAVDKADSAGFSRDDVLEPKGWELLSFLMDDAPTRFPGGIGQPKLPSGYRRKCPARPFLNSGNR